MAVADEKGRACSHVLQIQKRRRYEVRRCISGVPREDRQYARNECRVIFHEATQELLGRWNGNLAIIGDEAGRELNVRFRCIHLRRIAETQNAAETLLGDRGADRTGGCPDDGRGFARKGILAVGSACPVNGVLQAARDRSVIFRGYEQNSINSRDGLLEGARDRRKLRIS